ncbi:DUF91 domain-containing protein [Paenibacillus spiritus]|uniref:DUF91 domain-containing protein n=1 Tax=Paenibacillus spiritus TaxID=2496557 RepID=A0A5J5GB31_9BACL|nr:endonuclease NucS domain-containing protein [Paenibacillus spiritus]KAA9005022.1 DUF91 domain-containing protein [Paenibacillus spiritus]
MSLEVGIWKISGGVERLLFSKMETENKLEEVINRDIGIIDPGLLLIGRQVYTAYGKIIDMLAINSVGDLTIIELKKDRTPRDVVAQIIDYASWVQTLDYDQIASIYSTYNPVCPFEQAFYDKFQAPPPERINENHTMIIVSSEIDFATERIIQYLSSSYGVPINAVFFKYFKQNEHEYLARTWLIDPYQVEANASNMQKPKPGNQPWNGHDFYVSLGEGEYRNWEDCIQYGFVSAGQGRWYSNTLQLLKTGSRIFACIPKVGYVGVGIVEEPVVPVREFKVRLSSGEERPILEVPLKARSMGENLNNPDLCEYVVRVKWEKTVPREQALWEKGMFANQNSACKLRNKFTLEKLSEFFRLDEEL